MCELFHYYYLLWSFFVFFSESICPKKCWFFFCILAQEYQEAFSERCSLISGVLQGLVKICKKYMGVNHFWEFYIWEFIVRGQFYEGQLSSGAINLGAIVLGQLPGEQFSLGQLSSVAIVLEPYSKRAFRIFVFLLEELLLSTSC